MSIDSPGRWMRSNLPKRSTTLTVPVWVENGQPMLSLVVFVLGGGVLEGGVSLTGR